jgi:hypothetical protein
MVDYEAFDDVAEHNQPRPGDRVFHRRFGAGVVRSIEDGAPPTIVAHFPGFGAKRIRADYLSFG